MTERTRTIPEGMSARAIALADAAEIPGRGQPRTDQHPDHQAQAGHG